MKLKKYLLIFFITFALCMPSWAEISFYSWGRVVTTPLAFSGNNSAVSAATTTWGDVPSIGFSANGTAPSGNIGFNLDFNFGIDVVNGNNIAIIGDNAKAWYYPLALLPPDFNMVKIVAGWFVEDELRGKVGATEFGSWVLPNGSKDEDYIFTRLRATAGAYMRLEPLKWWDSPWNGLTLHAVIGSNAIGANGNGLRAILNLYNNEANKTMNPSLQYGEWWTGYDNDRYTSAKDVYRAGQYAIGYRIPDIGLARFQFIGSNRNTWRIDSIAGRGGLYNIERQLVAGIARGDATRNADVLEAAFLYNGLPGLRVDMGFKYPMKYETDIVFRVLDSLFANGFREGYLSTGWGDVYTVKLPNVFSIGANWTPSFLPELNIQARLDTSFGGKIEGHNNLYSVENGTIISAWLIPSYKITPQFTLGMDLGMDIHSRDKMIRFGTVYPDEWTEVTEYTDFGFAPWIEMAIGGGRIRTGVVVMLPGSPRYKADNTNANSANSVTPRFLGDPVVSIPISATYSF